MNTLKSLSAVLIMILAALGFVVSAVVHIAALCGIAVFSDMPWFLHIGIFAVWLPTMWLYKSLAGGMGNTKKGWDVAMRGCPAFMRYAYKGLGFYAILNFILFLLNAPGKNPPAAVVTRGFSGHWMVFYFAAFAICYSYMRVQERDPQPRCKNGHPAPLSAKYCQECGASIEDAAIR